MIRTRARVAVAVAAVLLPATGHAAAAPALAAHEVSVGDWFALGSGCRARASQLGDVRLELAPVPGRRGTYRITVHLPDYRLDGGRPAAPGVASFARECALRLAIHPASGKRLRTVTAVADFTVDKAAGARARVRTRLFAGDTTLATSEQWLEAAEVVAGRTLPVALRPSATAQAALDRVACEQPKIVGLDLSAATVRADLRPRVAVALDRHLATITLELEDCAPRARPR